MPSSTSSSERWLRTWLIAAATAAVLLGSAELALRRAGLEPSLEDSAALWWGFRSRISDGRKDTVALIGTSRTQFGIDPAVLSASAGGAKVIQLARRNSSMLPVLEELAGDPDFRGLVVAEIHPSDFFSDDSGGQRHSEELLKQGRRSRTPAESLEQRLSLPLQSRVSLLRPEAHARTLLFQGLRITSTTALRLRSDRLWTFQPAPSTIPALVREGLSRMEAIHPVAEEEFVARIKRLRSAASAIVARGGRVLLLRMGCTGPILDLEERRFDARARWGRLTRDVPEAAALSFEDLPLQPGEAYPDLSHLGGTAVERFTRDLAAGLDRRGLLK